MSIFIIDNDYKIVMKILVVDDNQTITKMLEKFFKLEGDQYELAIAENGATALNKYAQFKPDVVILDLAMPVMDGLETLTRLLKLDKNANVVIATASSASDKINTCLQKGARGYVEKPYNPEELLATIKNLFKSGASYDDVVTVFTLACSKIQSCLHKIVGTSASILLKDLEINLPEEMSRVFTYVSDTGHAKPEPKTEVTKSVDLPVDCLGFVNDISGQMDGAIIAIIKINDLRFLAEQDTTEPMGKEELESYEEFFNIVNNKVFSQISDLTQLKLTLSAPRSFDKAKDTKVKGKELIKLIYEISKDGKTFPLEFYLWFNISFLLK